MINALERKNKIKKLTLKNFPDNLEINDYVKIKRTNGYVYYQITGHYYSTVTMKNTVEVKRVESTEIKRNKQQKVFEFHNCEGENNDKFRKQG